MAFKRLLILGGAALLIAGCSTDVTAPIAQVDGAASSARAKGGTTVTTKPGIGAGRLSATAADSAVCRSTWPIVSGGTDTTCIIDN